MRRSMVGPAGLRSGWRGWRAGALAVAVAFSGASAASAAADAIVIGDSLGVGVSMASGLTRLAKNSVAIRGGGVLGQLNQAAPGSVVFMSLGTNDAVGRVDGLEGDIGRIIRAASGVKLVWIGPPCVSKSWDTNAQKLDGIIRAQTSGTPVVYVSMRDASMCDRSVRAGDGVHFTMSGYGMMWAKARTIAGYEGGSQKTLVASAGPSKRSARRRTARRRKQPTVVADAQVAPAAESTDKPKRKSRKHRPVSANAEP